MYVIVTSPGTSLRHLKPATSHRLIDSTTPHAVRLKHQKDSESCPPQIFHPSISVVPT